MLGSSSPLGRPWGQGRGKSLPGAALGSVGTFSGPLLQVWFGAQKLLRCLQERNRVSAQLQAG